MILVDWQIRRLCHGSAVRIGVDNGDDEFVYPGIKPIISPLSEPVSGNGIVSYGLTAGGYDLRLAGEFWMCKGSYSEVVQPRRMKEPGYADRLYDRMELGTGEPIILPPHSYVLAKTVEYFCIPRRLMGTCVGKSTLARAGVLINTTPLEPEWDGYLTLEIGNVSPCPVGLVVGEGIAQVQFHVLAARPEISYADKGGVYQSQQGVVPARVRE